MNNIDLMNYWIKSSDKDMTFFGQLLIEKLLKAYYAKMNMKLKERQEDLLETISDFNMEARYGDYKYTFELKCTDEYTNIWIENIKELREWLKKLLIGK